jgi:sugar transferase (PEP-CTERM/EpsH1 system associated)
MRNLLFLSHRIPYPPDKGEKIRAFHILRHLTRTHRIHLGCLIDDPQDWQHRDALRPLCADLACFPLARRRQKLRALLHLRPGRALTLDYFHHPGLANWVNATLARTPIDRIFVYSSAMAPYVMDATGSERILDMVDIDSEKWAAYATETRGPMRFVWAREGRTLLAFEREAAVRFDHTFLVSAAECRHFAALAPESAGRVDWVNNGVDLDHFAPDIDFARPFAGDAPAIVFTGTMDYRPNVAAVCWFAHAVLPLLRRRDKPPVFHIVGANPAEAVRRLAGLQGVHVTGRVEDARPYIAHAALVVAPLRIARGIQNKVLEAMAMARPVLASPQAFEGIEAVAGRDLLVADGEAAMAQAAGAVLDGAHPHLGVAARRAVERGYAWKTALARLDHLLDGAGTTEARAEPSLCA